MILIDSSVWIDWFNDVTSAKTTYIDDPKRAIEFLVGDVIALEVLRGFSSDTSYQAAKDYLQAFPIVELCSQEIAFAAADHYRFLRKRGVTVRKTIDGIIASYCILNRVRLLHNDRDFIPYEKHLGLKAIDVSLQ